MKKNVLFFLVACAGAIITLTSSSNGPAHNDNLNRSAAGCGGSGCHNATNSNNTIVGIALVDKVTGNPVSNFQYTPGRTYRLYLLGSNSSGLTKFGFQITCVQKAAQTVQAGTFANWPSTVWSKPINGIQVVEHGTALLTNSQGVDSVMMEWTAPAASAGTVRFNYMLNAVNGNSASTGDEWNGTFSDFDPASAGIGSTQAGPLVALWPNPAVDVLYLRLKDKGAYLVQIADAAGRIVSVQKTGSNSADPQRISVSSLSPGLYHLLLKGESASQAVTFIKQ